MFVDNIDDIYENNITKDFDDLLRKALKTRSPFIMFDCSRIKHQAYA